MHTNQWRKCLTLALFVMSWVITGAMNCATAQTFTEYTLPTANGGPRGIIAGPDGALWFLANGVDKIGRITTAGVITIFGCPICNQPIGIAAGADGALWFTMYDPAKIG